MVSQTDIFVVGGGPAGLAAAIAARQKGFDVAVADAAHPPIDKTCGEGLMPDSIDPLQRLGIELPIAQTCSLRGIRFLGDGVSVDGAFPVGAGIGIRRTVLQQLLADRAAEVGVRLLWGTRVTGISRDAVLLDGREVRFRWLVGADGQNSRVRHWVGLSAVRHESIRFGFRRHYHVAPWTNHVEIYWRDGCQMYVTPVNPEMVSIALMSGDSHLRFDAALGRFPDIAAKIGAAEAGAERGAVSASRSLERVCRGNTVLIGDASGSLDAITGEGLCLAFRQALALADALHAGRLADYQAVHRRIRRRSAFTGELLLLMARSPALRRRVLRALAADPDIFGKLLAVHVGELSSVTFLLRGMLPLGWQMIRQVSFS